MLIDTELTDPENMDLEIDGLTIDQIRDLKKFYQSRTGDMDLQKIKHFVRFY